MNTLRTWITTMGAGFAWLALTASLTALGCSGPSKPAAASTTQPRGGDPGERMALTPTQLVEKSKPAIVRISSSSDAGIGFGTGFLISPDGRVVTNLHVIGGAKKLSVTLADGTELDVSEVMAYDIERDLAIIKLHSVRNLPTLTLGDSDEVSAGDSVVAIGNPLGVLDYTVSDGLISAVRNLPDSMTLLQISAPISQGSSGGPLFNVYGEVIGVAVGIFREGQNLNFGIPSNYVRPLITRNERLTLAALADKLRASVAEGKGPAGAQGGIVRQVPQHPVTILDGCSDESIRATVQDILSAIQNGAPVYNQGNHEACFRIYEGTAIRLESDVSCPGIREALGQGLLRASTEEGYTRKAWAMRDTFDGILLVASRKDPSYQQP